MLLKIQINLILGEKMEELLQNSWNFLFIRSWYLNGMKRTTGLHDLEFAFSFSALFCIFTELQDLLWEKQGKNKLLKESISFLERHWNGDTLKEKTSAIAALLRDYILLRTLSSHYWTLFLYNYCCYFIIIYDI